MGACYFLVIISINYSLLFYQLFTIHYSFCQCKFNLLIKLIRNYYYAICIVRCAIDRQRLHNGCANTVQSENGRPRIFLFELAKALSVVCRASSSSRKTCIRKKMISQAFAPVVLTVESVVLLVLAFYLLYRYGDIKRQNIFVTALTLCIWFLSFFIVFLLPIDVSSVSTSCLPQSGVTCHLFPIYVCGPHPCRPTRVHVVRCVF